MFRHGCGKITFLVVARLALQLVLSSRGSYTLQLVCILCIMVDIACKTLNRNGHKYWECCCIKRSHHLILHILRCCNGFSVCTWFLCLFSLNKKKLSLQCECLTEVECSAWTRCMVLGSCYLKLFYYSAYLH